MAEIYCGIDFGTSNSSIAIAAPGSAPSLVAVENRNLTIPSALFYENNRPGPCFGEEAVNAFTQGREGRFMRSLKRVLGTELMSSGTAVNGKNVKFSFILGQFINHLKNKAQNHAQTEINSVVMGRPVHFRDNDIAGDIRAEQELYAIAKQTGFKNIVFQYEPIAAAFAHETKIEGEKLACVIDIGGGTSDFSIIRIGKKRAVCKDRKNDILASSGVRIGGNDFDKSLCIHAFMPQFGLNTTYGPKNLPVPTSQYFDLSEWSKVNSVYSFANRKVVTEVLSNAHQPELYSRLQELLEREQGHNLLNIVEETKIKLTSSSDTVAVLAFLSSQPQVTVAKYEFEEAINSYISKLQSSIEDCLIQAQTMASQIETVILTGGSTEIPSLQKALCAVFPKAVLSSENKLSSVGLGLAFDSLRRFS